MWFFWWNGRSGGARFFWVIFFVFFATNFFRGGFIPLVMVAIITMMILNAMRGASQVTNHTPQNNTAQKRTESQSRRVEVGQRPRTVTTAPPPMPIVEEPAQEHAITAARAVGINPRTATVLPIDIGVIAYHGDETTVHRTWRVSADAEALQPFINLRVKQSARGRLRFEIRDDMGALVFFYERDYALSVGENLMMPPARMPIDQSSDKSGTWTLRVLGDNLPLAEHRFEWHEAGSKEVMTSVGADGEISDEMRVALARTRLDRMSLDELLGDDDANQSSQKRM
jgi:hypothetical protein